MVVFVPVSGSASVFRHTMHARPSAKQTTYTCSIQQACGDGSGDISMRLGEALGICLALPAIPSSLRLVACRPACLVLGSCARLRRDEGRAREALGLGWEESCDASSMSKAEGAFSLLTRANSGVCRNVDDTDMATGRQTERERTKVSQDRTLDVRFHRPKETQAGEAAIQAQIKKKKTKKPPGNQEQVPTKAQTGARARKPEPLDPDKGMRHCFD
ncbi:hypothetical protein BKA80DRAFT_110466 [Phyllosticta citrichinensis]